MRNRDGTAARRRPKSKTKRRIGIVGYDGVQGLDLVGPADAFAVADECLRADGCESGYDVVVLGLTRRPFSAESPVLFVPRTTLKDAPSLDTLLICGGRGLREPRINFPVTEWVREHAGQIRRIASVCTGIYALANTGLLDGMRVTTHWKFARDVAQRFPRVLVDANAIFIRSGKFYTAAGVTAGIDLALGLIEEDHGRDLALTVARELVMYLKRPGGQEQYSEPLQFQMQTQDRIADLAAWIAGHLHQDLSVENLAERARLSPRQFTRRFKQALGLNPGEFVEKLRLDEARRRLAEHGSTIESVADSVGFGSGDSFRRAFERRFGLAPSFYRGRFGVA